MRYSEETTPQPSEHVSATVQATASRTDASIQLTLAATPAQTQPNSTSTVKSEPIDVPLSQVTIMATISLQTQPSITVESPVIVANGSKTTLKVEEPTSVKLLPSSASVKAPDATQASTPRKSAMKQKQHTTPDDGTHTFSVSHEQLRPTTPVQTDNEGQVAASPKSQSAPKTPTKPMSHEVDDLVSGFGDLHVDRSKSQRPSNKLSNIPSPHSVRIQDPSGRATVYGNIHFPEAYINKIQSHKPELVCSIQSAPSARSPRAFVEWNGSSSNAFDSDEEPPVRLSVDRSKSTRSHRIHSLSNSPSSNKVVVDHGNGV
ncbi:hypothetical protein HDU77_008383 [Chytriomyces hyalinus]|nr:hypothetical protein HDU77_008383 [Chytriomyces hyalinus]